MKIQIGRSIRFQEELPAVRDESVDFAKSFVDAFFGLFHLGRRGFDERDDDESIVENGG